MNLLFQTSNGTVWCEFDLFQGCLFIENHVRSFQNQEESSDSDEEDGDYYELLLKWTTNKQLLNTISFLKNECVLTPEIQHILKRLQYNFHEVKDVADPHYCAKGRIETASGENVGEFEDGELAIDAAKRIAAAGNGLFDNVMLLFDGQYVCPKNALHRDKVYTVCELCLENPENIFSSLECTVWAIRVYGYMMNASDYTALYNAGTSKVFTWLIRERLISLTKYSCDKSARHGNLQLVKLHHNYIRCRTASTAAYYGHFHIVKFLVENNYPISTSTITAAARSNYLDMVKWLLAHGCPVDASACRRAAAHGHLPIVKHLVENGYPVNPAACKWAAKNKHVHVVRYLVHKDAT